MQVTIGKNDGKSVEWLVLKDPSYIEWLLGAQASGKLLQLKHHAQNLIRKFDAKPISKRCYGQACSKAATRATVYLDNLVPYWWCATCDPYESGANAGKLQVISTYSQALHHVEYFCKGRKSDAAEIIKYLAQAKGLPSRVGEQQAQQFFV
jgi:hypothetical protein